MPDAVVPEPISCCQSLPGEPPQNGLQHAAVAEVRDVDVAAQPGNGAERALTAAFVTDCDGHLLAWADVVPYASDRERLASGQAKAGGVLSREVLQGQDPHSHEVGPMDPLVRLRDHGADALQERALGGPVATAARPVFLPGQAGQRR